MRLLSIAGLTAGIFLVVLGLLLLVKAFFADALSSYGYGIPGLIFVSIGFGLFYMSRLAIKKP